MCSNETTASSSPAAILPYPLSALKSLQDGPGGASPGAGGLPGGLPSNVPVPVPGSVPPAGLLPLDQYRLQLYNYAMAERLQRFGPAAPFPSGALQVQAPLPLTGSLQGSLQSMCPGYGPYGPRLALSMSLFHQRMLQPEEPKPQHSYIGLIAMAILSSPDAKLVLSDIYQYILDNYPYFRTRGPGWRNSIRHNLSLNDCFIKAGRSANGKGHYWAVHPANVEDFKKGDFRRRKAQRKVRKHMGLAVDEEGNESPSPPPTPVSPPLPATMWTPHTPRLLAPIPCLARKRQFDVASLLAPDDDDLPSPQKASRYASSGEEDAADIDVVTSDVDIAQPPTPTAGTPQTTSVTNNPLFMSSVEQHLVSRYYEQLQHSAVRRLALQHQQQQQQQQQLQLQQHLQQLQNQQSQQDRRDLNASPIRDRDPYSNGIPSPSTRSPRSSPTTSPIPRPQPYVPTGAVRHGQSPARDVREPSPQ